LETFFELIRRVVTDFGAVGLDYMFTGALAASFYGVPRTTTDIDVVVDVSEKILQSKLVLALKQAGLLVDEKRIDETLRSGYRIATFEDSKTPYSVYVIFSSGKLEKRAGNILGLPTFYQTPEELILAKLRMIKATVPRERALKDRDDVKAILRFTRVDTKALKERARKNSTLSILEKIIADTYS
jgi:hypothetical protein